MKNRYLLPLGGILLAGCSLLPSSLNSRHNITLSLQPRIHGYVTQELITPYASASINHLVIKLFTVNSQGEHDSSVSLDIDGAHLAKTINFGNLAPYTSYRIKGFAYKASGTAANDLISNASSSLDVALTDDDAPQFAALPVYLIDRPFVEQATASMVVYPGVYIASDSVSVSDQ